MWVECNIETNVGVVQHRDECGWSAQCLPALACYAGMYVRCLCMHVACRDARSFVVCFAPHVWLALAAHACPGWFSLRHRLCRPSRSTLDPVQHEQGPELRSYAHGCVARTVGSKGRGGQCHAPGIVLPMLSCHEEGWCEQALLPTPSRSAPCNRGTRTDSSSSSSSSRRIMAPPRCQSGNRIGDLAHAGMGSARIAWGKGGGEGQLVMQPV
jgi:hypothetical protein